MTKTITLILAVLLFCFTAVSAQTAEERVVKGDEYAAVFDHEKALAEFEAALKLDPQSYDAAWRASKELSAIGNNLEFDEAEKDEIEGTYARAVEIAEQALILDSWGKEAHFYMAVAKGRLGLYKGKKEMIELSKDVKKHADTVLQKDPDFYRAHYLMGRWNDKIANVNWMLKQVAKVVFGGLPPASNEQALEHYTEAVRINPQYVECHKELGRFYMDRKEWQKAVDILTTCVSLPETDEHDARFKQEARTLLEKAREKVK